MNKLLIGILPIFVSSSSYAQCIAPVEYVKFTGVAAQPESNGSVTLGTYSRISPDGKFVLRSIAGSHTSKVTLNEIFTNTNGKKLARSYNTRMDNEAFPVQGTWRYVVDPGGDHYQPKEILNKQKDARKSFNGGINGFYTAAAELPSLDPNSIKILSLSGPTTSNNEATELTTAVVYLKKNSSGQYEFDKESKRTSICGNLKNEKMFTMPMISVDGTEFSAVPTSPANGKPSSRIYKLEGANCILDDDLGFITAKTIFGFARDGKKAPVIFMGNSVMDSEEVGKKINVSGVHYYDRDLKKSFYIGDRSTDLQVDAFPGATKDGRIIVGAKWKEIQKDVPVEQSGYVIMDPFQSESMRKLPDHMRPKKCITRSEVAAAEKEQAGIYGLTFSENQSNPVSGSAATNR
ncbi:MAG: hypothetical protein H7328_05390 [Bdellovibrio sp.]|nr:hypothetical protein [Bdellovibrio sp.]